MQIDTSKKEQEIGFDMAEAGEYIAQLQEGVKRYDNENTGGVSLGIPFKLVDVYTKGDKPGSEKSVGAPHTHFFPIANFSEKRINQAPCDHLESLIVVAGLADKFMKQFNDYDDMKGLVKGDLDKLVEWLALNFPDKLVGLELKIGKNFRSKEDEAQTKKWWALGGSKPTPQVSNNARSDEDWD